MITERRGCLRHKVRGPIFASFDGVTGGMILDLSEQGLSMQTVVPLEAGCQRGRRSGKLCMVDILGRADSDCPIRTLTPSLLSLSNCEGRPRCGG
jgi:hypothetical protein